MKPAMKPSLSSLACMSALLGLVSSGGCLVGGSVKAVFQVHGRMQVEDGKFDLIRAAGAKLCAKYVERTCNGDFDARHCVQIDKLNDDLSFDQAIEIEAVNPMCKSEVGIVKLDFQVESGSLPVIAGRPDEGQAALENLCMSDRDGVVCDYAYSVTFNDLFEVR